MAPDPVGLTPQEAAALLRVSVDTLRRWRRAGKVAYSRPNGGAVRYLRSDLEALLVESRRRDGEPKKPRQSLTVVGRDPEWLDRSKFNPITGRNYGDVPTATRARSEAGR